ncbi:MAG: hypothetical protein HY769_07750 [Candidatus Stahlbacteria bacterium]|nr:hypothetical protein [Candidatus Stahlbacteria bacterium]
MRKLFFILFVFVVGCAKNEGPIQQFVLSGTVRLDKEVKEGAKIKLEMCKHTKWYEDEIWETTTDKWGRYQIIVNVEWFGEYYRVRASAFDKFGTFHLSEYQHGIARATVDKKDIALGEKQVVEEKKKYRRRRF